MFYGWRRHWEYFKYVARHKFFVAQAGWQAQVSWSAFILCLLHDMNKFHPTMWFPYARHFYNPDGTKTTTKGKDGFYNDPKNDLAFDRAQLWHIQRSKHHPQYWVTVISARCDCTETPLHIQYQYGMRPRRDVLLKDEDGAQCLTCGMKLTRSDMYLEIHHMPERYILEMLCDWKGAGLAQGTGDTLGWYKARGHKLLMTHPTRTLVEGFLEYSSNA